MKLIFIRHGEGVHTIHTPESLHIHHPSLTERGEMQVKELKKELDIQTSDLVVASPTLRTIQTAEILTYCEDQIVVHPFVGPRIFPYKGESRTLRCDQTLAFDEIKHQGVKVMSEAYIYGGEGVNKVPESEFDNIINKFLTWCRDLGRERIFIVTHDGTITRYREAISGEKLSRDDFLKDAGWVEADIE